MAFSVHSIGSLSFFALPQTKESHHVLTKSSNTFSTESMNLWQQKRFTYCLHAYGLNTVRYFRSGYIAKNQVNTNQKPKNKNRNAMWWIAKSVFHLSHGEAYAGKLICLVCITSTKFENLELYKNQKIKTLNESRNEQVSARCTMKLIVKEKYWISHVSILWLLSANGAFSSKGGWRPNVSLWN